MFVSGQLSGCVDSCWRRPLMNWTSIEKVGLLCQMTTCLLRDDLELQADVLRSDSCPAGQQLGVKTTLRLLGSRDYQVSILFSAAVEGVWLTASEYHWKSSRKSESTPAHASIKWSSDSETGYGASPSCSYCYCITHSQLTS